MPPLNAALVGCGFMGRMHSQVYRTLPTVKLVQTLSKYGESAKTIADQLGATAASSYDEILSNPKVDFVDICLPTDLHAEFAIKALKAGKHVLCEKPMAIDLQSADAMLTAARESGKTLMIAQCIRFWPEYQRLTEIVASGDLGALRSLQLTRFSAFPHWSADGWIAKEERSGGAALDLHIHDTDYICSLLGSPKEVVARGTVDDRGVSRVFSLMQFGGTAAQIEGGWDLPSTAPFRMAFRAVFDGGLVMFDGGPLTIYRDGQDPVVVDDLPKMSAEGMGGNISDLGGYYFELEYFTNCLASGKPVSRSTPESSLASLAVALDEIAQVKAARSKG